MSSHETPGTAGSDPQREPAQGSTPRSVPERREVTVRRAPKYVPFLILGGLVGVAAAAIIAYALPGDASYDASSVFGFFMVLCAAGGVILGAAAALVLDRMSVRRAEHAVVESAPDADDDGNRT
ncbi:hypothetical protein SAMN04487916_106177 [Arthrobacter sp. ov407]|uniref:hypothetical protein n=1 Tax=Arthrobacter sp. ov407 TaxID=1761748 RepID=UPI00088B8A18|nr:hypothetical protein [Arthrobacter sp. ov407]SDL17304.1 hypothetical protein SAMN04487916_106177 [Arthrobacter sp. ov407]